MAHTLKPNCLEKEDEEALFSLIRRHIAKVRELTDDEITVVGTESKVVKLSARPTLTVKLAGGVLERRMFEYAASSNS